MNDDSNVGLFFSGSNGTMLVGLVYAEPTVNPAVFSASNALNPIQTLLPPSNGVIPKLVSVLDVSFPTARYLSFAVSYETDLDLYNNAYSSFISRQHFTAPAQGRVTVRHPGHYQGCRAGWRETRW